MDTGDLIERLAHAETEEQLLGVVAGAARELGFDHCAYGMRQPLPVSNPRTLVFSNYPSAWQRRYAEQNYLAVDPTVAHAARSALPLVWSDALFSQSPAFWEEARGHGLRVGWAQSSYDAQGSIGMLTLARGGESLEQGELRAKTVHMSWLAHATHAAMSRIAAERQPAALTARETEVLRWTADGKTSGEIGQIMAISERTVNFHINNAVEKLGAVNKTAGVVKAAMLRLL